MKKTPLRITLSIVFVSLTINLSASIDQETIFKTKSSYPEVTENIRDPFWRPGYTPGKDDPGVTVVRKVNLPPEAFQVTGITGAMGTPNVTITMNRDIIVDVNEEFPFDYQGRTFMLRVIEANEDYIVIDNEGEKITVMFGRKDAVP